MRVEVASSPRSILHGYCKASVFPGNAVQWRPTFPKHLWLTSCSVTTGEWKTGNRVTWKKNKNVISCCHSKLELELETALPDSGALLCLTQTGVTKERAWQTGPIRCFLQLVKRVGVIGPSCFAPSVGPASPNPTPPSCVAHHVLILPRHW